MGGLKWRRKRNKCKTFVDELDVEGVNDVGVGVGEEGNNGAVDLLVISPSLHHGTVVGACDKHFVDAPILERVLLLKVAGDLDRRSGRGEGARESEQDHLLAGLHEVTATTKERVKEMAEWYNFTVSKTWFRTNRRTTRSARLTTGSGKPAWTEMSGMRVPMNLVCSTVPANAWQHSRGSDGTTTASATVGDGKLNAALHHATHKQATYAELSTESGRRNGEASDKSEHFFPRCSRSSSCYQTNSK